MLKAAWYYTLPSLRATLLALKKRNSYTSGRFSWSSEIKHLSRQLKDLSNVGKKKQYNRIQRRVAAESGDPLRARSLLMNHFTGIDLSKLTADQ
jgi:hypothetical protein